jgi:hypothetical protein
MNCDVNGLSQVTKISNQDCIEMASPSTTVLVLFMAALFLGRGYTTTTYKPQV